MPLAPSASNVDAHENLRLPLPRLAEISLSAQEPSIVALSDEGLREACGTRIAFTQRSGGESAAPFESLNLSLAVGDEPDKVHSNRAALCHAIDASIHTASLIMPNQVHGDVVLELDNMPETLARATEGADGIVCTLADVPVLLCFADCVPIILVAPDGSFAVLHSGWRGTMASIAAIGLRKLSMASAFDPACINCYIGPHIGACCYEVSDELMNRFEDEFGSACDAGSNHLDLTVAVREALLRAGADDQRIVASDHCTSCRHDLYYSHRAEHGMTGRHGAFAIRKVAS